MNMEEIYQSIEHIAKCEMYDAIEVKYLKSKFEELQQENEILKENAEKYDKVVNKINWDNELLKKENKQLKIQISAREEVCNRLESNWNKLKEYLNYQSERAVGEDEYVYDEIYNEMQEIEKGSDNQ